jgi:iron complex transport system ATP-binding protein
MRLRLASLSVEVAGARLIDALSLEVGSGEVVGLVGPNGSGKSTALRCVYRALRPTEGAVLLDDIRVDHMAPRDTARKVAALTQDNRSELDFTVSEVVALGRYPHTGGQRHSAWERDLCHRAMARTDVLHLAERSVLSLSGGERQRVLVARALAQEPKVLVLDEPTNHLDIRHQLDLLALLHELGLTVVVALHDLNLAASSCDRLAVLDHGHLVAAGPVEEVLTPELVSHVFGVEPTFVTHPRSGAVQLLYQPARTQEAERALP